MIDTHCHLHREEFDSDREQVIERGRRAGVVAFIDPATDLASNRKVVSLAAQHPDVYAAIGVHPHDAGEFSSAALQELTELSSGGRVVAVGEIGLDYYRDLTPREIQQEVLRKLLGLAHLRNLPVILHCRGEGASNSSAGQGQEVYRDLLNILRQCLAPPFKGLLHCFAGDAAIAEEALSAGLYISFAGNLTFPKADALRAVARLVPLEKIVLETDAPFLSPQPYRGKRNEPAYLGKLVEEWSAIRGLTPDEVASMTTANSRRLFGIR